MTNALMNLNLLCGPPNWRAGVASAAQVVRNGAIIKLIKLLTIGPSDAARCVLNYAAAAIETSDKVRKRFGHVEHIIQRTHTALERMARRRKKKRTGEHILCSQV